jgi:hypothetical protein
MSEVWTRERFVGWLAAYGAAWEARDAPAFARLFSDECAYHWTPAQPPYVGPAAIAGAFARAVATQDDIRFSAEVLSVDAGQGLAHWTCVFTRRPAGHGVRLDGILLARAGPDGTCAEFREWWHLVEPAAEPSV